MLLIIMTVWFLCALTMACLFFHHKGPSAMQEVGNDIFAGGASGVMAALLVGYMILASPLFLGLAGVGIVFMYLVRGFGFVVQRLTKPCTRFQDVDRRHRTGGKGI